MNGTSALVKAFAPLPGGATAVYNASGLQYYRHPDWLGSSRFSSTPSRTMYNDLAYAPFGEQYAAAGTTGITNVSFAGNNQDTTTNLYDAQFREYEIYGRWPSPDPAGTAVANPANPQSWNRYAYVMNNPLVSIDPLGLMPNHGCLVAGHQGDGVPNYGNCGPPTGGSNCDLDGAVVPCGGGDGSGGGGGGFGSIQNCTGEVPYWQSCTALYIFSLPTGTGGPGSGDPCGGGDCFGGGSGSPQTPTPISPQAQKCMASANAAVQSQLQTFAGYAGVKLLGRVAIGAAFGAAGGLGRFLKTENPWAIGTAALVGAMIGAGQNAYADSQTIQNIQNSFMGKVAACMEQPPGPPQ